ncbi:MAG: hypothetical protein ACRC9L_01160 [Brevinema sp.]
MKKTLLCLILLCSPLLAQESQVKETITDRAPGSSFDQGIYWDNSALFRWNYFGAGYLTKIYYRKALHRDRLSFMFAGSVLDFGIEQSLSSLSRTSAFVYYQPLAALSFLVKVGYAHAIVPSALLNSSTDDYSHGLPPFSGLNPLNRTPVNSTSKSIQIEFAPTLTIGGAVGKGLLAVIYTPTIRYYRNFSISENEFHLDPHDVLPLRGSDVYYKHDLKFGYVLSGTGMSFALTTIFEHLQSGSALLRASMFGSFSYEKALQKYPNVAPYFKAQIGSYIVDRYAQNLFGIQIDTGVRWKIK